MKHELGMSHYACAATEIPRCKAKATGALHYELKLAPVCEMHYDIFTEMRGNPEVWKRVRISYDPETRIEVFGVEETEGEDLLAQADRAAKEVVTGGKRR